MTAVYAVMRSRSSFGATFPLRELPRIMRESMVLVGGILLILGVSLASTNYMIDAQVPEIARRVMSTSFVSGPTSFLLLLFVFLLDTRRHPGYISRPSCSSCR